jgi:hypothetical protein
MRDAKHCPGRISKRRRDVLITIQTPTVIVISRETDAEAFAQGRATKVLSCVVCGETKTFQITADELRSGISKCLPEMRRFLSRHRHPEVADLEWHDPEWIATRTGKIAFLTEKVSPN